MNLEEKNLVLEIGVVATALRKEVADITNEMNSLRELVNETVDKADEYVKADINKGNIDNIDGRLADMKNGFIGVIDDHYADINKRLDVLASQIESLQNRSLSQMISQDIKTIVNNLSEKFVAFREKVTETFKQIKESVISGFDKVKENAKDFVNNVKDDIDNYDIETSDMEILKEHKKDITSLDFKNISFDRRKELLTEAMDTLKKDKESLMEKSDKTIIGKVLNVSVTHRINSIDRTLNGLQKSFDICDAISLKAKECAKGITDGFKSITTGISDRITDFKDFCVQSTYDGLSKIMGKCEDYLSKNDVSLENTVAKEDSDLVNEAKESDMEFNFIDLDK